MPHRWMHPKAEISLPQRCFAASLGVVALALGGCATQYRPVVSAINPVGPAAQPTKYAYAVSDPNDGNTAGTLGGLLTTVDFSGDTILSTPALIPNPNYFAVALDSLQGFVVNAQGSLDSVPVSQPLSLITSQVVQTTLPAGANVPSLNGFTLGGSPRIFVPEISLSQVALFSSTSPALQQQISVSPHPVYVVGVSGTPRAYVISNGVTPGQVAAIEGTSLSVSATIPVGNNPVYGVETADTRRAFILNNGSGSVSVINVTNNAIDSANPTINLNVGGVTGLQPVWADLVPQTNQLVVISQRAGNAAGYLSIINIPLCNALAQPTNPSCNPTNPTDGQGFGQVLATVPVGINPMMVSALVDGSQAYVANEGVPPGASTTDVEGSVSVVNLVSGTVTTTITGTTAYNSTGSVNYTGTPACSVTAVATGATNACVYGHPTTIAATSGTPTGKVYVTAPDSNYMTVIETDTNSVDTHLNLQGAGVRVLVSAR